jgi:hypothetical protein
MSLIKDEDKTMTDLPLLVREVDELVMKLEAQNKELVMALEMVMKATSCTDFPDAHPVHFAFGFATHALQRARGEI